MTYVSLYRKWRPQTFADVVAQSHVVRTLANALSERRIAHAYLFTGPRGTGKTTIARLLAKGLNCTNGPTPEPCGVCESCKRIADGMAMDVVEIDGASNRGIDEMREVRERVRFAPSEGAYKVYIIDEVHMLTNEAFNALLKVLEEPPAHVVFVFATTEPHRIPGTVTSRCQRFDFRRLSAADATARLAHVAKAEGIDVTEDALALIARYADGSLRDGLSILDQARAYEEQVTASVITDILGVAPREQVEAFATVLAEKDTAAGLALVKQLQAQGRDLRQFLRDAARYLRDVLLYAAAGQQALQDGPSDEQLPTMKEHAQKIPKETLLRAIDVLGAAEGEMRLAAQSHLPLEMAIIRLTAGSPSEAPAASMQHLEVQDLLERIGRLEAEIQRLRTIVATGTPTDVLSQSSVPATTREADVKGRDLKGTSGSDAFSSPTPSKPSISPAPSSSVTAAPGAADEALTAVLAQWDNLLEQLRRQKQLTVHAFLREGKPIALTGQTLIIEFPPERSFHKVSLAEPANAKIVEDMLASLLGRNIKIETVTVGEYKAPVVAEQTAEKDAATAGTEGDDAGRGFDDDLRDAAKHPLVQDALKIFGGEIVDVERVDD